MPKQARFTPVKKPEGWQINVPASMTPDGRRVRRFFETRDEARAFAETLVVQYKNEGTAAFGLSSDQRVTAVRAFALLEESGVSDLISVVREGLAVVKLRLASKPFGEVFDKYISSQNRSEIYTKSLQRSRKRLGALADVPLASITADMLEVHVAGASSWYRNSLLRELRAVLNYGVKKDWAARNPVDRLDFAKTEVGEREIYTVPQAAALLGTAVSGYPILLPFVAIGLFAGVRVFELLRSTWEDIALNDRVIDLGAGRTKRKRKRFIRIEPALDRWLRFANERANLAMEGKLIPAATAGQLRDLRRPFAKSAGIRWMQNAMRHSYASYWNAEHEDLDKLALHLGHTKGLDVLHRYYHRAVKKPEAHSFWGLTPVEEDGNIVVRDYSRDGHPRVWTPPGTRAEDDDAR